MTVPSTSGIAVRDMRWAMGQIVGEPVVEDALGSISASSRELIEAAPTTPWIPVSVVGELIDAVVERSGMDEETLLRGAIFRSTEKTLTTVWRALLRFTTDEAILKRTPILYQRTRNIGRLEVLDYGKGHASIEVRGWPNMTRRSAFILAVNIEAVLTCAGRKAVRATWRRCADGADYQVRFRR